DTTSTSPALTRISTMCWPGLAAWSGILNVFTSPGARSGRSATMLSPAGWVRPAGSDAYSISFVSGAVPRLTMLTSKTVFWPTVAEADELTSTCSGTLVGGGGSPAPSGGGTGNVEFGANTGKFVSGGGNDLVNPAGGTS